MGNLSADCQMTCPDHAEQGGDKTEQRFEHVPAPPFAWRRPVPLGTAASAPLGPLGFAVGHRGLRMCGRWCRFVPFLVGSRAARARVSCCMPSCALARSVLAWARGVSSYGIGSGRAALERGSCRAARTVASAAARVADPARGAAAARCTGPAPVSVRRATTT